MVILAVDNDLQRLGELERTIVASFREGNVLAFQDPLLAGKYGFFNRVDILFAEKHMKRMDGPRLAGFIKDKNPQLKAYIIADDDDATPTMASAGGDECYLWYLPRTTLQTFLKIGMRGE